jgi:Phage derived protein Gp49-like (DUF891)
VRWDNEYFVLGEAPVVSSNHGIYLWTYIYSENAMAFWSFLCYDPSGGERMGFHAWYDALPPALMAEVDRALDLLSRERRWVEGFYKELDGACEGLGEIRIDAPSPSNTKICVRILGFTDLRKRVFHLLVGFEKTAGDEYRVECPRALRRKQGVLKDGSRAPPCEFP